MLKTLRRIVQEVGAADSLSQALEIVVERVCEVIHADSSSVYLIDPKQNRYVLMASRGFHSNLHMLSLGLSEGLIGLVGQREEPINLENAQKHPKYRYFPETGEERYSAFLGTPIIHQRKLLGVLVVQQQKCRRFDEGEEAFLVTMSAQLAVIIAHAEATGDVSRLTGSYNSLEEATIRGVAGAPGIAIGTAIKAYPLADLSAVPEREAQDVDAEIQMFQDALTAARDEMQALSDCLATKIPEQEQVLFDAYMRILDNASLGVEVEEEIHKGQWAQGALRAVIQRHVQLFESMEDEYLRERAADLRDLGRRVLSHLQTSEHALPDFPENTILVGDEVTASRLAEVPQDKLVGVVSAGGSGNSHVAILARSMGLPTVMGAHGLPLGEIEGQVAVVDGYNGRIYLSPSAALLSEFERLAEEERELYAGLEELKNQPAETPDGKRLPLYVNTGLVADIPLSLDAGAEGVGLYRTEVPFIIRDRFPTEEEQRAIYRKLLSAFSPRQVTMRTLDVGGDKTLPYFPVRENNPFLGWRGIRVTLDHPEVFLMQIRAMLRASVGLTNLKIMLPMVSCVSEIDEALRFLNQAYLEVVEEEGEKISMPSVGAMIEVPSAVYQAERIAERVDFLSVGTNDLTQYMLAVDRNNARVASLYDALHPAVLQAIYQVVQAAHRQSKMASVCGEMAGDPAAVILLLAMNFDALSMNATSLSRVKWVIRNFNLAHSQELLEQALCLSDATSVRGMLDQALDHAGLGGLIRAGK